jgi:hypothetical protein
LVRRALVRLSARGDAWVDVGSSPFPAELFNGSGLTKPFTTYVLTFSDKRAGIVLYNIWGKTATKPTITTQAGQFADGAVVVKSRSVPRTRMHGQ